jgi:small subunit ribosomal protein S4
MITPPRYKTARRLGASTYEKTLSPKFALRSQQKSGKKDFGRPKTDYGMKMLEKQRVRFSYGISEKQFSRYVREANESRAADRSDVLYVSLETRLDNVVFRTGLAASRQAARQLVSHGHIQVNGKRVTIPSYTPVVGDIISISKRSAAKKLFEGLEKKLQEVRNPAWIALNIEKREFKIQGAPKSDQAELYATLRSILEFYKR